MQRHSEKLKVIKNNREAIQEFYTLHFKLLTNYGFSYIEVIIALALIVVVGLGGGLSLFTFSRAQDEKNAAKEITGVLRDAQQRSIVQEEAVYWGVLFENLAGRDRYGLIQSPDERAASFTVRGLRYLKRNISMVEPIASSTVLFNKITGAWLSSSCPSAVASTTITINNSSIRIYCDGSIR